MASDFVPGLRVKVADGPFRDFLGTVVEVEAERRVVRIAVRFFGRDIVLDLDFSRVVPVTTLA
ncbi:MAG: KOW motif-containing protein [Thermomicrobiales bacterium]